MSKQKYKAIQFIEAIKGSGGTISTIAEKMGCSWNTAKKYIDEFQTVTDAYLEELETNLDLAESVVITNIKFARKRQESFIKSKIFEQVDSNDAKWLLSRKGKQRGYGESIKVETIHDQTSFINALLALRDEGKLTPEIALQEFGLDIAEQLWPGTKKRVVILQDEPSDVAN